MKLLSSLLLFVSSFSFSSFALTKEPTSCRELNCNVRTQAKWAACIDQFQMKTTQFHVLTADQEKIFVCEGDSGGYPSHQIALSVPPYLLPSGTKLAAVDKKSLILTLTASSPREVYKELAKNLAVSEAGERIQMSYCKSTKSFNTFCASSEEIQLTESDEQNQIRAYLKRPDWSLYVNGKGIHVLEKGKRVAFYEIDGHFETSGYGQHGAWYFLAVKETDGDYLTSHLIAYSPAKKKFQKVSEIVDIALSVQVRTNGLVNVNLTPSEESEGSFKMAKGFEKCPKGQFPKSQDKPTSFSLDVKSPEQLKLESCGN